MLGYILLVIALYLYFKPKYRYVSYFFYLSFMMGYGGGLGLWTNEILQVKNMDMAIIYTFIVNAYLLATGNFKIANVSFIRAYKILVAFLTASVFFSHLYYELSFVQILQGCRNYLLIFSLPILAKIKLEELEKILRLLLFFVTLTSVLYILQVVLGRPLMPYGDFAFDSTTGLARFYNQPANLRFFLVLSFVYPSFFRSNRIMLYRVLFIVALLCTQGRTGIFVGIMTLLLALVFNGSFKRIAKTMAFMGILLIPFVDLISERFGADTGRDLQLLVKADYGDDYQMGSDGGATMTYRFAWIYERWDYLVNRPVGEQIFGLGLVSDSQPFVHQKYRFRIGLLEKGTGLPAQLYTPDTSYGNLLTKLGFVGMLLYLLFAIQLALFFYKNRNIHPFYMVCSAQTLMMFVSAFSGSSFSETKGFAFYFMLLPLYFAIKGGNGQINSYYEQNISRNGHI